MSGWYFAGSVVVVFIVQIALNPRRRSGFVFWLVHLASLMGGAIAYTTLGGSWETDPYLGLKFNPFMFLGFTAAIAVVLVLLHRLAGHQIHMKEDESKTDAASSEEAGKEQGCTDGERQKTTTERPSSSRLLARMLAMAVIACAIGFWMAGFNFERWNILFWWPQRVLWLGIPWVGVVDLWTSFSYYTFSPNPDASIMYAAICWAYQAEYVLIAGLGMLVMKMTDHAVARWIGRILRIAGWCGIVALSVTGLVSLAVGVLSRF